MPYWIQEQNERDTSYRTEFNTGISASTNFRYPVMLTNDLADISGLEMMGKQHPRPIQATPGLWKERLSKEQILRLYEAAKAKLAVSKLSDKDMYGFQVKVHKWSFSNKLERQKDFWASAGEIFSGSDGGKYRYLVPEKAEDRNSVDRALQLTREDFRALTGKESPVFPTDTSYHFQYQSLQLEIVALMVWEQGYVRIPKLLCVGPFVTGFGDWSLPDVSVRVKVECLHR